MRRWNYRPADPVFMDVETQSSVDLREKGAGFYLRHEDTRLLSAVFLRADRLVVWVPPGRAPYLGDPFAGFDVWMGERPPPEVRAWIDGGATFAAHNAEGFDAPAWDRFGEGNPSWLDTIPLCRAAGVPGGLDAACKALGIPGKDAAGGRAMKLLCPKIGEAYVTGTGAVWRDFLRYNVQDVRALAAVYDRVIGFAEPDVLAKHHEINDRGIPIDEPFAGRLAALWAEFQDQAKRGMDDLTDGEITGEEIRSVPKVRRWLARHGLDVPSLARKELERLMADPEGFFGDTDDANVARVTAVILARQQAVRATSAKVAKIGRVSHRGRVHNTLVYHGASTGRWSGRDVQPHNMARGVSMDVAACCRADVTLADVQAASKGHPLGDCLATLMRPIICAPEGRTLVSADFAGIEARGVAWVARESRALDTFADPTRDVYLDMARAVFGDRYTGSKDQRQVGKVIVLGCGYQMGAAKFGASASLMGVDLAAVGTTAEDCVASYRATYPRIAAVWRAYDAAARGAVAGRPSDAGRCHFDMDGDTLRIHLPSGRAVRYHRARIEMIPAKWAPTGPAVPTLVYDSPQGYPKTLYGGLLAENVVQAVCRDLLAAALVAVPWPVVLHVHDEIVCEVAEEDGERCLHDVCRIMSTPPAWATGFPIRVEGHTGRRFTKAPWPGAVRADYINGERQ